ncbi:MAG: sulfatase-like hydrolase/transferase [Polyangiaceae bacterium]
MAAREGRELRALSRQYDAVHSVAQRHLHRPAHPAKRYDRQHDIRLRRQHEDFKDTIIIFTADHGEMAGAHGLRTKGPFIYKENNNVPLVICHPDGRRGVTTSILASALDLAPTLMSLAGLSELDKKTFPFLYGHDFSPILTDASFAGARSSILFTYTSLSTLDAGVAAGSSSSIDLTKRGFLLGIHTGTQVCAVAQPDLQNHAGTIEELRAEYDLGSTISGADPNEITGLANDSANDALVVSMNNQLNALVEAELSGVSFPTRVPADLSSIRGSVWIQAGALPGPTPRG